MACKRPGVQSLRLHHSIWGPLCPVRARSLGGRSRAGGEAAGQQADAWGSGGSLSRRERRFESARGYHPPPLRNGLLLRQGASETRLTALGDVAGTSRHVSRSTSARASMTRIRAVRSIGSTCAVWFVA
jgi:hypothetical protein